MNFFNACLNFTTKVNHPAKEIAFIYFNESPLKMKNKMF